MRKKKGYRETKTAAYVVCIMLPCLAAALIFSQSLQSAGAFAVQSRRRMVLLDFTGAWIGVGLAVPVPMDWKKKKEEPK